MLEHVPLKKREPGIFGALRGKEDPTSVPFADERAKQHWFTRAYVCFAPTRATIRRLWSRAVRTTLVTLVVLIGIAFLLSQGDHRTFRISKPVPFGKDGPLNMDGLKQLVWRLRYHAEGTLVNPEGEGPYATNVVAAHHLMSWQKVLLLHECDEARPNQCSWTGAYTVMVNPSIKEHTHDTPMLDVNYVPLLCPSDDDSVFAKVPSRIKVFYTTPTGDQVDRTFRNPYNVIFVYQAVREQYGIWPCKKTDLKVPRVLYVLAAVSLALASLAASALSSASHRSCPAFWVAPISFFSVCTTSKGLVRTVLVLPLADTSGRRPICLRLIACLCDLGRLMRALTVSASSTRPVKWSWATWAMNLRAVLERRNGLRSSLSMHTFEYLSSRCWLLHLISLATVRMGIKEPTDFLCWRQMRFAREPRVVLFFLLLPTWVGCLDLLTAAGRVILENCDLEVLLSSDWGCWLHWYPLLSRVLEANWARTEFL